MKTARKEQDYQLNIGDNMARGLFNITDESNDDSLESTARMRVSNWLDIETKDWLMSLSSNEFIEECENLLTEK